MRGLLTPQKILIVDSDLEAAGALAAFLFGRGYVVIQATDGQAGLRLFLAERPGLVITETILPTLHGFELCARIKKDPEPVPVIILSEACEDDSFRAEAKRVFGALAYLPKPFDGETLLTEIKRAFPPANELPTQQEKQEEEAKPVSAPRTRPLDDVDALLDAALAELGLDLQAKAVPPKSVPPPAPPSATPPSSPPLSLEMTVAVLDELLGRDQPGCSPETESPPLGSGSPPEADAASPPPAPSDLPETGSRRGKTWWKRLVAAAGFLLVASALVFIFAAKKAPAPAVLPPSKPPETVRPAEARPEEAAFVEAGKKPFAAAQDVRPAGRPPAEASDGPAEAPPEVLKPLLPAESPQVKLEIPSVRPAPESTPSAKVSEPSEKPAGSPAAKASRGDLIDLAAADVPPRLLVSADPAYPSLARARRLDGQVSFLALISEDGEVREARLIKGPGGGFGFEAAAQKALLKWRYKPAEKDGVPVRVWKPITIVFKFSRSQP